MSLKDISALIKVDPINCTGPGSSVSLWPEISRK